MQPRPPGFAATSVFDATTREARRTGRNQRRVQASREEHSVGHVTHQLSVYRLLEGFSEFSGGDRSSLSRRVIAPWPLVISNTLPGGGVEVMSRWKLRDVST